MRGYHANFCDSIMTLLVIWLLFMFQRCVSTLHRICAFRPRAFQVPHAMVRPKTLKNLCFSMVFEGFWMSQKGLGMVLGALGGDFWGCGAILGALGWVLWALGRSWGVLGRSWGGLGVCWGSWGGFWRFTKMYEKPLLFFNGFCRVWGAPKWF